MAEFSYEFADFDEVSMSYILPFKHSSTNG